MYHAEQDLRAARFLAKDAGLCEPAVFHCQQAVEIALKSYLLFTARRLFDGHNITWLCKQAALSDGGFAPLIEKTADLNKFYIETRYPADIPTLIDADFTAEALACAEDISALVRKAVKFDFNSYHKRGMRKA
jgi:HEPN domain-containing protein